MAKRNSTVRLADKYDLSDLEPDVDPQKAAAFLAAGSTGSTKLPPKSQTAPAPNGNPSTDPPPATDPDPADVPLPAVGPMAGPEIWTSRTIRLRQSTAKALTKALCGQKSKQADGKVIPGEPVTVQEIADRGIRLVLAELGYVK